MNKYGKKGSSKTQSQIGKFMQKLEDAEEK